MVAALLVVSIEACGARRPAESTGDRHRPIERAVLQASDPVEHENFCATAEQALVAEVNAIDRHCEVNADRILLPIPPCGLVARRGTDPSGLQTRLEDFFTVCDATDLDVGPHVRAECASGTTCSDGLCIPTFRRG